MRSVAASALHGGLYVALGDAALVIAAAALLEVQVGWDFVAIVALGVYAVYGFNHLVEARQDAASNPDRAAWVRVRRLRQGVLVAVAAVGAGSVALASGRGSSVAWVGALLSLGFAYSLGGKSLTRVVPGFKTLFVAGMFGALVPFLAAHAGQGRPLAVAVVTALYAGYLVMNSAFCDLKDAEADRALGLRTWVVEWGTRRTLGVLHALNGAWGGLLVAAVAAGLLQPAALALLALVAYRAAYLEAGRTDDLARRRFLADVVADGESYLWLVLLAVGVQGVRAVAPAAHAWLPWPTLAPADVAAHGVRTPWIADERLGVAACAAYAGALGAALKVVDDAWDEGRRSRALAIVLFGWVTTSFVALVVLHAVFATVVTSLVVGVLVAGKVDTAVFALGASVVLSAAAAFGLSSIEWVPAAVLAAAVALDEWVDDALAARSAPASLRAAFRWGVLWKLAAVLTVPLFGWPPRYAVAILAFDLAYGYMGRRGRRVASEVSP